jgi:hypothetical protein
MGFNSQRTPIAPVLSAKFLDDGDYLNQALIQSFSSKNNWKPWTIPATSFLSADGLGLI